MSEGAPLCWAEVYLKTCLQLYPFCQHLSEASVRVLPLEEVRVQCGSAAAARAAGLQAVAGYQLTVKFVLWRYLIQQAPEAALCW